jgi:Mrp family chromosome partitioning ATPase
VSPAEPTPQPDTQATLAPIKRLRLGGRTPDAVAETRPATDDDAAGRLLVADGVPATVKLTRGGGIGWTSVRAEVLDSCSVALRHMGDSSIRSLAVTSTARGEGRTTVAIGLAATASSTLGHKTILIDLDIERGDIERSTSVDPGPGVLEYLHEGVPLEDCLQSVDEDIDIMRAGQLHDRGGLTGQMRRLGDLVQNLNDRCDVLIADLPPLSSGVEAARIADLFESVTLVVRAGGVDIPRIESATSVLSQRPFIILNGTSIRHRSLLRRIWDSRP